MSTCGPSPLRDERGFSLAEVIAACGVLAIIALGSAQIMSLMSAGLRNSRLTLSIDEVTDQMRSAMASRQTCTLNLGGTAVIPGAPSTILNRKIRFFDAGNAPVRTVVDLDQAGEAELDFKNLEILSGVQLAARSYLALIRLGVEKKDVLGATFVSREIPARVEVDGAGKITSCILGIAPELTISNATPTPSPAAPVTPAQPTAKELCEQASGGMMSIDPATGKCAPLKLTDFSGSPTEAKCAAGYELPPAIDPYFVCDAIEPDGYEIPDSGVYSEFPDGTVIGPDEALITTDMSKNTCKCAYRSDINSAGWSCVAHCMKSP